MTDTTTTDLASWLLEQIADDEKRARQALLMSDERFASGDLPFWERRYHVVKQIDERTPEGDTIRQHDVADCGGLHGIAAATHILHWEPARVLAECDAKRRMVKRHSQCDDAGFNEPCDDLRDIASVYSGRPGYRPEWRPT